MSPERKFNANLEAPFLSDYFHTVLDQVAHEFASTFINFSLQNSISFNFFPHTIIL